MKSHRQITILLMVFFLILNTSLSSQTKKTLINEDNEKIYTNTEKMPKFPGGNIAFKRWITNHLNYPAAARESGIQGTVFLRFEVKKDGTIGEIKLEKGVETHIDQEALRVIKSLPKFKPGEQNNKKVNSWDSIFINFLLN